MIEDSAQATRDSYEESVTDKSSLVKLWLDAISVASTEEETWRDNAQKAVDIFRQSSGKGDQNYEGNKKFNILHSNIETIVPALYNSTPAPDVRRRFNDADPVAKQVADIQERCLSYAIDSYDFDHVMKLTIKDMELPGRGVARVRYIPYASPDGNGVAYQEVLCEHILWKHFRRGPANEWGDVSWVAFELFLTREQLEKLSSELGSKVNLDVSVANDGQQKTDRNIPEIFKRARVWEIWDKDHRQVLFIAESYKEEPLVIKEDPYELRDFFPVPRPIYGVVTGDSLVPIVPYEIYRAQAEELERISQRIIILTEAVKAKAIYDGRLTEMERLEKAEDTDHISLENVAIFADGSKIQDHIMFYPIETIVGALEKCFEAREQIKQTIYEITGISDILRGQSVASETATAQNIKQQWGSLRIQQKQQDIQRFARDLFRLKAELFASKFEPQVLQMMTGIQITPEALQLLQSDKMRGYRVDIESDSTIRADMTRNQQNMTLFLQGTAQFAQAMGPIVMTFKQMTPAVLEVYAAFARNFKLGKQAEDALDSVSDMARQLAAQPQPPQQPDQAAIAKLQAEAQQAQQELAFKQQSHQAEMMQKQGHFNQKMQFEREKHANEMGLRTQELQNEAALRHKEIYTNAVLKQHEINTNAELNKVKSTHDAQIKREQIAAKKHKRAA